MKRKRLIYACLLSLVCSLGYAQVNDQLSVDKTELVSEKQNGFDKISWKGKQTTQEIGKPELPFYRVSYVLPIDAVVTGVSFKNKSKQHLDGIFYLYPVQKPIIAISKVVDIKHSIYQINSIL